MSKPPLGLVKAGKLASVIHQKVAQIIAPGVNLLEIEQLIKKMIDGAGMVAAFQGFNGYPAVSCLSVNSAVVHGIPYNYRLKEGDVISVDLGVSCDGWIVDTARTHPVGRISPEAHKLLKVTDNALQAAIHETRAGNKVGDIGFAVQSEVERAGFHVIRELTGHGVGRKLQMPPPIPNHGRKGTGQSLEEGMILAIEPITALKPVTVSIADDNWTVQAEPNVVCAHFEDTVYITSDAPIILTA